MHYKISVVIRTFNEQKHIGEVLESLKNQTYDNYEVLIIDSESTDNTLNIVSKYGARVVGIKKADFNYSYASNVGVNNATGDLICFLSGHSVPVKASFLSDINDVFQDDKVGGCYGLVIALPDGSWIEKLFSSLGYIKNKVIRRNKIRLETEIHQGILSCNNACIRKELLIKHPFADELARGGEDVGVAYRIIQDGYYIARDPKLMVMHSHGSNLKKFLQERKAWDDMWEDIQQYIMK